MTRVRSARRQLAHELLWLWLLAWWGRTEYEHGLRIGRIQGCADTLSALLRNPHKEVRERARRVPGQIG